MKRSLLTQFISLILLAHSLMACEPEKIADYSLAIQFLTEGEGAPENADTIVITVWGYSHQWADQAATKIKEVSFHDVAFGEAILVEFMHSDLEIVKPQTGEENEFDYYISFDIDVDGDGRVCNGDLVWNYDRTDMIFLNETDTGLQDLDIHVAIETDVPCR